MALDSNGFKRKRFAEIFEEMEAKAKETFGEQVNTSQYAPLGIILRIVAFFFGRSWQTAEDVYNSAYKDTAQGNNLDRLGPYVGLTRIQETYAMGDISITGTAGYTVAAGFRVATAANVVFETLGAVTLNGSGLGTANIKAVEYGRNGNTGAGTITNIVNPNPNVLNVTNAAETAGGREKETDAEFRDRFTLGVAGGGAATLESIRGALLRVAGVRAAAVVENTGTTTDGGGRPAKSFEAYVLGGVAADIGQTILMTKAAGIATHGDESIVVNDISGNPHTIKYSYADEVTVYIKYTLTTDSLYPASGSTQLKSETIRYIGGEDADGVIYTGLNMGENVIHARLVAAAFTITGVIDAKVETSIDGEEWDEANIGIDPQEVAQAADSRVTVVFA